MTGSGSGRVGAYGVSISGLETSRDSLVEAPESWPCLSIERAKGACEVTRSFFINDDLMELRTADRTGEVAGIRLTRTPLEARFTSPGGFTDAEVLHPDLGAVAAVISHWRGRDAFHAGAFITPAGAWAVLGERGAGKSSLMAQLAAGGHGVLTDDIVVVDEEQRVLAGPRCVDLREGAAEHLGLGSDIGMIGARRRWRMDVDPVPPEVPLRGWVLPEWGDEIGFDTVPVKDRPAVVFSHRYIQFVRPPRPADVLALSSLPFVIFRRPRRWDVAEEALSALVRRLGAHS